MVSDTRLHSRGNTQGLMNTPEIVIHEVQSDCVCVSMIFNFLAESIGKACEAAVAHAHGEILALDI